MKTLPKIASVIFCLCSVTLVLHAQVPQMINYQGRVLAGSTNFDGSGQFKFALVNTNGTTTYWSNNGSSSGGSEPSAAVTLTVTKGLYSVLLGDTSIANMTVAIPSSVFTNSDVRLRVWFNDGTHGSQLLTPDQRIAAVGYTFMADNIKDGAITTAKIATGAVGSSQLGSNLTLGGTTTGTFSGSGSALTNLAAANISGIIPNASTTGTSANTPNTLVLRDANGSFSTAAISSISLSSGSVGVGTATPAKALDVTANIAALAVGGSVDPSVIVRLTNSSNTGNLTTPNVVGIGFGRDSTRQAIIGGTFGNDYLDFFTSGALTAPKMRIANSGNVGIGTATPAATLDVAGTINIPATTSATNGVIQMAGTPIISALGTENVFFGNGAGNFTLTGTQNTAVGVSALDSLTNGTGNTAVGYSAASSITTAASATAIGFQALSSNTTGFNNTAIGAQALLNTTAGSNTATGSAAALHTTTGSQNTATGHGALFENTTGSDNTADGFGALGGPGPLMTGSQNTATGSGAAGANIAGSNNTAMGYHALKSNMTGQDNTAVGWSALVNASNGFSAGSSNNIGIGKNAGMNITTGSNNIDIGNVGAVESNTIRIGTSGTQTATFIAGINGVTISPAGTAVFINSNGQLGTTNSSGRFKTDIKPMDNASDVLLSLKPVTFHYKPEIDAKGIAQFGLIAEEVAEVCPDLVIRDAKGELQTVRYEQVNAMLLNEFLKEHKQIAEMKKEEQSQLAALRSENAKLRAENAANAKRLATLETRDKERDARLTRLEISMPAGLPVANTVASSKAGGQ